MLRCDLPASQADYTAITASHLGRLRFVPFTESRDCQSLCMQL